MKVYRSLLTRLGKYGLVLNILNPIASVKVPKKRMTERKKTSGTAWVILSMKQAGPVRFPPWARQVFSEMQPVFTMRRYWYVMQSSRNLYVQFELSTNQAFTAS